MPRALPATLTRLATAAAVVGLLAGCAGYAGPLRGPVNQGATKPEGGPVPPGHMPPPGQCRIWYKGKPPGQQPPPGDCGRLSLQVPPGAVLIGPGRR
jgi:hypothetical protein